MTAFSDRDRQLMAEAVQLARRGDYTCHPNPRVGCIIARDGEVVGRGWHVTAGEAHAEINALRDAGDHAAGADVYVTLEPCAHFGRTPPCADALLKAGVRRVVAAMVDPNPLVAGTGLERIRQAGIEVASGLLAAEAAALNPGFISAMRRQRPWVRIKSAMSLDGRTAMASGESVWITGEAARRDVQFCRARAGAVLTGIDTVLQDKPSLNVRLTAEELGIIGRVRQPERVILDSQLRVPLNAAVLLGEGMVRVYTCATDAWKIARLSDLGVQVRQFAGARPALPEVLAALHVDGINEVHVEAGATLTGELVRQGLADELIIYLAGHLMGSTARPLFHLPLTSMAERRPLQIRDIRAVGNDWRIQAFFDATGD